MTETIGIGAIAVIILLVHWSGIRDFGRAWRFARRYDRAVALHAERRLQDTAAERLWPGSSASRWPACAHPACDFEENWTCRVHCRKCRATSPCLAHDDAFWAVIGEGRITQ
jgi:hypothetical protein